MVLSHRQNLLNENRDLDVLVSQASHMPSARGFIDRVKQDSVNSLAVIAEIKRKSPSKGELNTDLDAAVLAEQYWRGGASCLSVLTDVDFFGGSVDDLVQARTATTLPVIRKDFTVSEFDVVDARLMGADCVLLIAAVLSDTELQKFHQLAIDIGLDVLVETHDEQELDRALNVGATMIGVNQRDLMTFQVDHERAERMATQIPQHVVRVAESGVRDRGDAQRLRDAGYDAVLVGESIVTSGDPVHSVRDLMVV
ncbi:MAG: indole-3-glycerol phosphate synthase TrpC [Actinobacteria bacterium]|nr:indole-3-glycerol phosphate synthase TrpC [Actinomycetota bacterium]